MRRGCRSATQRGSLQSLSAPVIIAHAPTTECCRRLFHRATSSRLARSLRSLSVHSTIPAYSDCASWVIAQAFSPGLRGTDGPSNTRTFPNRWPYGTSGRQLPPTRSHSSLPQPDLRSTGTPGQSGGSVASALRHCRTPPVYPRPDIPCSTCGSLSTSPIASLSALRQQSSARSRKTGASSPSGRPSSARSSRQRTPTAAFGQATEWRADALDVKRHFASWMRSSLVCINPATVTLSSSGPLPMMRC